LQWLQKLLPTGKNIKDKELLQSTQTIGEADKCMASIKALC
jgi:hypothetical protein